MAFSSNGQWMIVDVPYVGLFRVSADLTEMVPFAKSMEQIAPDMAYYIAISNDGNYVALSTANNLTLHGLASCSQHNFTYGSSVSLAGCNSREIWNGHNGIAGVKEKIIGSNLAERLQFIDDDTLKIVGRHYNSSNTDNIYDEYYVSAPGTTLYKLAFLGMGDSYISGEGIGVYQEGTDTDDNKCHLSPQSYPNLIGRQYFDSFASVACSGAKTIDVDGLSAEYGGQTKNKIKLSSRNPDLEEILAAFSPGYAQQRQFINRYHPKTALISIGGNDVDFAGMVKSCVVPEPANPICYSTHQERKQKAREIYEAFDKLVNTYNNILNNGTENLYVVGYPEVAKENGNCGVNVHLSNDEIIFSNELIHYLNQTIEAAANRAGARYVDIEHALDGHRLCEASNNNIAMNGLTAGNDTLFIGNESYHPNALGHKLIMKKVLEQTNNMQEVMPAKDENAKQPEITDDMPLLAGLTPAPELSNLESVDDITNETLVRGTPSALYVAGLEANTAPNTKYRVELHSNPTTLGYLTSDANGNISGNVTIPTDIAPGIHTLNLYGPSYGGEQIQIQQFVYVAASENDADGNGVPNSQQQCVVVEPSGQDADEDGIDDACDPVIGETSVAIDIPQTTASSTSSSDKMADTSDSKQSQPANQLDQDKNKNAVLGDKTAAKNRQKQAYSEDSSTTNFLLESLVVASIMGFGITLLLHNKSAGDL
jgi:lysophospholipase L1-like esterase